MSGVDVHLLDELAASATAPGFVTRLGGWRLRADAALPFRRSNTTLPWADGSPIVDVEARIDEVEAFYRRAGVPPRFQIGPRTAPGDLDERLARRGYAVDAPVDLLTASVEAVMWSTRPAPSGQVVARVADVVDPAWSEAFAEDGAALERIHGYARLLARVRSSRFVAMVDLDGCPAAMGLGVIERGWIGVFGMVTRASHRRRGAARAVLQSLGGHARVDATNMYLQVEVDNVAATSLYESVGFVRSHGYHYRVLR